MTFYFKQANLGPVKYASKLFNEIVKNFKNQYKNHTLLVVDVA